MSQHVIKSLPVYAPIALDRGGRRHLLIEDAPGVAEQGLAAGTARADFDARWTIVSHSQAIPSPDPGAADQSFRSSNHLLDALRRRLSREAMGFRLYAVGAEPFLWRLFGLAHDFGLGRQEVALFAHPAGPRRVYCNHCRTINEGVTTNIVACAGCRAHLFVRDHFSRRLNAYAGVQADAEDPGEIPVVEELYR